MALTLLIAPKVRLQPSLREVGGEVGKMIVTVIIIIIIIIILPAPPMALADSTA